MKKNLLIIGGDSRISKYLKKISRIKKINYISTSRRKNRINKNILFFDFLKFEKFKIPQDINSVVILAGIDGEKNCEKNFSVAKKISKEILPKLIKIFAKKNIFVCYLSSMAIYNKKSLYGNLRLLAEKKILNIAKKNKIEKKICIIRPTKNLNNVQNIYKTSINLKKSNFKEYFQPLLYSDTAKFIIKVIKNQKSGIFDIKGKNKIYFNRHYLSNRKKILYRNNYTINKPNYTRTI